MTLICDELDDYLDGTLSDDRRRQFCLHVDDCFVCRDALELQQRIERLLRQATCVHPPPRLKIQIERQIRIAAGRRRAMSGALAAAAAVCMYFALSRPSPPNAMQAPDLPFPDVSSASPNDSAHNEYSPATDFAASSAAADEASTPQAQVTVITDQDVIAVRKPSKHANVSVYLLYPTVRTAGAAPPAGGEIQNSNLRENAL